MERELNKREAEKCPVCDRLSGWVTHNHCYCAQCLVEFNPKTKTVYEVNEDGTLTRVNNKVNVQSQETTRKYTLWGLKHVRLEKKMTIKQLSKLIGYSETTICGWERNHRQATQAQMEKISNCLSVSITELRKNRPQEPKLDKTWRDNNSMIKEYRKKAGLTLKEAGNLMNKPLYYISELESHSYRIPELPISEQQLLANILNVDLDQLMKMVQEDNKKRIK